MSSQHQIQERKRIAGLVREKREKKGLTVKELAFYAGVSPSTVYDIERGRRSVTPRTLIQINTALTS